MNEDDSQSDPHPEASTSQSLATRNSGTDDAYDMVTGVQEEILYRSNRTHIFFDECTKGKEKLKEKRILEGP